MRRLKVNIRRVIILTEGIYSFNIYNTKIIVPFDPLTNKQTKKQNDPEL